MRRARIVRRITSASYARSPRTASGRQRGLPRSPWSGGIPSSNANACVESWQLAPVVLIANGIPRPSQIKWRLLPRLARSVGFGPVSCPQKLPVPNNCRPPHTTNQSGPCAKASSATRSETNPRDRPAANRAVAASSSYPSRNPALSGACSRGCHCEAQTQCP